MLLARPAARDVGISARDAVNESEGLEERERTVDLRGGRSSPLPVEAFHDLVGSDRSVFGKQQLEYFPPIVGKAFAALPAGRFRAGEPLGDAPAVIVLGRGER